MPTNQEIKDLYEKKGSILKELFKIGEEVLTAQADLKKLKAHIVNTTDEKVLGTNDKKRDAYILEHTRDIVDGLEKLESEKRSLDLEYSLICDSIECMQWQIRNDQVGVINSGRNAVDPYYVGKYMVVHDSCKSEEKMIEEYGCSLREYNQAEE
jgi:hypothetical protein